ncbi:MAG: hypothetical protein IBJ19_05465 [Gemmatimonadaceae bacterium]|nr:hypothetical protein [Gemmatimonadaceae bacterium]
MSQEPDSTTPSVTVTANDLRRVAEAADGMRGATYTLSANAPLRDGGTGLGLVPVDPKAPTAPGEIRVTTPLKAPGKPRPKAVFVQHPGTGEMIYVDTEKFDAVFWGEAAIEKFLVPYYVRFQSEGFMQTLREAITNEEIIAVAHEWPSFVDPITDHVLVLPAAGATLKGQFVPLSEWLAAQK